MKKSQVALITISLIAAAALYLMDATQYTYHINNLHVQVYPAAFMGFLALWLLLQPALKSR